MKTLVRGALTSLVRLYYPVITAEGTVHVPPVGTPALFVANHPNGLLDPLVLRLALGQPVRFLGKSTLFNNPFGRTAMEAFGALPVYRHRDAGEGAGAGDTSRNEATFALCREALAQGDWIALFPEGTTHSDPRLKPLKTGAARIALSTLAAHPEAHGLAVVPVGLMYEQKAVFRSRALVVVGEALAARDFMPAYTADDRAGVGALTDAIRAGLDAVVLQADTRALLEGVARIAVWTADDPHARDDLGAQHRRTLDLLAAYTNLQARDPARVEAIVADAQAYMAALRSLGVADPWALEVPHVRPAVAAWAIARLVLILPLALVGAVLAWVPYRLAGRVAGRMTHEEDVLGTTKLLVGAFFIPLAWVLEAILVGLLRGWPYALAVLALGPLAGYAALRFDERLTAVVEGARHLGVRLRRGDAVRALTARRRVLADTVARALRAG